MENQILKLKIGNQVKIFNALNPNFKVNVKDFVVVESPRGIELAKIVAVTQSSDQQNEYSIKIIRKATEKDIADAKANKLKVAQYKTQTKKQITRLKLDMKIIDVEFTLDFKKIIITYSSEGRVDFRELVKALAGEFKMKIELKQIGARDVVQLMGGVGVCGEVCCCHKFSNDFDHVSIRMAKQQGLSLNPNNISGLCGKLLCCLAYENPVYVEIANKMPTINSFVKTPDGDGKVVYNNLLKQIVHIQIDNEIKEYPLEKVQFEKK